jgi:RNA polymerase sigma-70 factor, ECF subfamily
MSSALPSSVRPIFIIVGRRAHDYWGQRSASSAMSSSLGGVSEPTSSEDRPQHSTATSRSLLERIKADDAAAWDSLISLYAPLAYRWCRRWDLPEQEIADVLQEVFQSVATHIASFRKDREGDTFRGWLRTITQNKVLDHFRKLGREPGGAGGTDAQLRFTKLPAVQPPDPDDSSERRADRGVVGRALDLIKNEFEERTWRAFWLTAVGDRVPKEVALELGMSAGAVRVAKSRVLRRLREELGDVP